MCGSMTIRQRHNLKLPRPRATELQEPSNLFANPETLQYRREMSGTWLVQNLDVKRKPKNRQQLQQNLRAIQGLWHAKTPGLAASTRQLAVVRATIRSVVLHSWKYKEKSRPKRTRGKYMYKRARERKERGERESRRPTTTSLSSRQSWRVAL